MEKEPKREQKRQSAKKRSEHSVYTKKAVRAKEALIEKRHGHPSECRNHRAEGHRGRGFVNSQD